MRAPAVAGVFYPSDPRTLAELVDRLLADAEVAASPGSVPRAVVAPHAGYPYSGPIAASAFATLAAASPGIRRVVVIGPAHRVPLRGMAVPAADFFATPLGEIPIDHEEAARAGLATNEPAHRFEHSIEVEVPFLQRVAPAGFRFLPIVVGDCAPVEVGRVLDALCRDAGTFVVVSSDLSHYLSYDEARARDAQTARMVVELDVQNLTHDRACGATALAGLLWLAHRKGWRAKTLDLRNSGDTSGDTGGGVVGYGAFAFYD